MKWRRESWRDTKKRWESKRVGIERERERERRDPQTPLLLVGYFKHIPRCIFLPFMRGYRIHPRTMSRTNFWTHSSPVTYLRSVFETSSSPTFTNCLSQLSPPVDYHKTMTYFSPHNDSNNNNKSVKSKVPFLLMCLATLMVVAAAHQFRQP